MFTLTTHTEIIKLYFFKSCGQLCEKKNVFQFPVLQTNEVATDYNAGFQSTLAGLNKIYG